MLNARENCAIPAMLLMVLSLVPPAAGREESPVGFDPFASSGAAETAIPTEAEEGPVIPETVFNNDEISIVFQILSDATGWSIIPTTEVTKAKISVWAKGMTARRLLDTVVTMAGFTCYRQGKVITVMTYDEYAQFHGLAKEVIFLKHAGADSVALILKAFLSKTGRCATHIPTNALILLDSEASLRTIVSMVEKLDVADSSRVVIEVVDLEYVDAVELADTLQGIFGETQTSRTPSRSGADPLRIPPASDRITQPAAEQVPSMPALADGDLGNPHLPVGVYALDRTNQLILRASQDDIDRLKKLIEKLDTYLEPVSKTYHFTYVDASEIFTGLERTLDLPTRSGSGGMSGRSSGGAQGQRQSGRPGGVTLVEKTNSILLTAPPSVHRVMASIAASVDVPATYETGLIRIYKIDNASVEEVAQAIRELLQGRDQREEKPGESKFREETTPTQETPTGARQMETSETEQYIPQVEAQVAVSKATNSVIVQATARQHRELEKMIQVLDKRRRQVLIESRIVEITTTKDAALGVEVGYNDEDAFAFTSFGLSRDRDAATGLRDVIVSPGGTGVLQPGDFQLIVKALESNRNARVASAPRLLVNDNAIGAINSVAEEPYSKISQGQNTDTVSFGGFVEAGTQFLITPHISESGYLRVEYEITLNSFSAQRSDPTIPPPRNTSSIRSEATVPSGHTIVVGGLQTSDEQDTVRKVPLLGDIPLIGIAFRSSSTLRTYKTTYLFITPVIMEHPDFNDLKDISKQSLQEAERNDPIGGPRETDARGDALPPEP